MNGQQQSISELFAEVGLSKRDAKWLDAYMRETLERAFELDAYNFAIVPPGYAPWENGIVTDLNTILALMAQMFAVGFYRGEDWRT